MADYPDIKGFNIQSKSSDPVPFAQEKSNQPWQGTWASGGSLNTARYEIVGVGIQTAALAVGGTENPGTRTDLNESYNGTAWTELADLNTGRTAMGAAERGTTSSTVVFGGATTGGESALSESWNGSSWTETNDLNTAAYRCAGAGTLTAALRIGGNIPPATANTEKFDGTSWTEVNNLNQARQFLAGGGTQTSAVVGGGTNPGGTIYGNSETFDGTSWTETSDLNTARYDLGGNAADSTDALIYGGVLPPGGPPNYVANCESWDGSAWTEVADLGGVRGSGGGAGASNASALTMGGQNPGPALTTSEEWSFSGIPPTATAVGYADAIVGDMYYNTVSGQFKAIKEGGAPLGAWASGASMNTARMEFPGAGANKDAGIAITGYKESSQTLYTNVEDYNGTAWTEKGDVNTARKGAGAFGSNTVAFCVDGALNPPGASQDLVESWNGTAWTETTENNTARCMIEGQSVSTSVPTGIIIGGGTPPGYGTTEVAVTETWNGSAWTETGDLNTARSLGGAGGSSANAVLGGGYAAPGSTDAGETFNGSTWTEVAEINSPRNAMRGNKGGSSTLGLIFAGSPGPGTQTESWNGTSWTEQADLADAAGGAGFGNPASTMNAGGSPPTSAVATTEEWTASDFQIKTVTTS